MEIWKDVVGYEGLYQISNMGKIRNRKREKKRTVNQRGYYEVCLCKNGIIKVVRVHRLVAQAFIPNPHSKPEINHKNGIKTDNRVCNLEWATHQENIDHAVLTGLTPHSPNYKDRFVGTKKKIAIISNTNNEIVNVYPSLSVAVRKSKNKFCNPHYFLYIMKKENKEKLPYRWEYI